MTYETMIPKSEPYPPAEFWQALCVVYTHFLQRELALHRLLPEHLRLPSKVLEACQLLDYWRAVALEEGWLDAGDLDAWDE